MNQRDTMKNALFAAALLIAASSPAFAFDASSSTKCGPNGSCTSTTSDSAGGNTTCHYYASRDYTVCDSHSPDVKMPKFEFERPTYHAPTRESERYDPEAEAAKTAARSASGYHDPAGTTSLRVGAR
jgi:hypothetical protein